MTDDIPELGKRVYNTYLKVIADKQGRPYTRRHDFTTLSGDKVHCLLKLNAFFSKYEHIDINMFFEAPYALWKDVDYHPLDFYTKRKALNCYTKYKKYLLTLSPDDNYHLMHMVNGFYYIKDFCKRINISPADYLHHVDGIYAFLTHLQHGHISIYNIFVFDNYKDIFTDKVDKELKEVLYGTLYRDYELLYRKYIHSKKCRELSKKCLIKISK